MLARSNLQIFFLNYYKWTGFLPIRNVGAAKSFAGRAVWMLILLATTTAFLFQSVIVVREYLRFPKNTITEIRHEPTQPFPAVTVCALNPFKYDKVSVSDDLNSLMLAYLYTNAEKKESQVHNVGNTNEQSIIRRKRQNSATKTYPLKCGENMTILEGDSTDTVILGANTVAIPPRRDAAWRTNAVVLLNDCIFNWFFEPRLDMSTWTIGDLLQDIAACAPYKEFVAMNFSDPDTNVIANFIYIKATTWEKAQNYDYRIAVDSKADGAQDHMVYSVYNITTPYSYSGLFEVCGLGSKKWKFEGVYTADLFNDFATMANQRFCENTTSPQCTLTCNMTYDLCQEMCRLQTVANYADQVLHAESVNRAAICGDSSTTMEASTRKWTTTTEQSSTGSIETSAESPSTVFEESTTVATTVIIEDSTNEDVTTAAELETSSFTSQHSATTSDGTTTSPTTDSTTESNALTSTERSSRTSQTIDDTTTTTKSDTTAPPVTTLESTVAEASYSIGEDTSSKYIASSTEPTTMSQDYVAADTMKTSTEHVEAPTTVNEAETTQTTAVFSTISAITGEDVIEGSTTSRATKEEASSRLQVTTLQHNTNKLSTATKDARKTSVLSSSTTSSTISVKPSSAISSLFTTLRPTTAVGNLKTSAAIVSTGTSRVSSMLTADTTMLSTMSTSPLITALATSTDPTSETVKPTALTTTQSLITTRLEATSTTTTPVVTTKVMTVTIPTLQQITSSPSKMSSPTVALETSTTKLQRLATQSSSSWSTRTSSSTSAIVFSTNEVSSEATKPPTTTDTMLVDTNTAASVMTTTKNTTTETTTTRNDLTSQTTEQRTTIYETTKATTQGKVEQNSTGISSTWPISTPALQEVTVSSSTTTTNATIPMLDMAISSTTTKVVISKLSTTTVISQSLATKNSLTSQSYDNKTIYTASSEVMSSKYFDNLLPNGLEMEKMRSLFNLNRDDSSVTINAKTLDGLHSIAAQLTELQREALCISADELIRDCRFSGAICQRDDFQFQTSLQRRLRLLLHNQL